MSMTPELLCIVIRQQELDPIDDLPVAVNPGRLARFSRRCPANG